MFKTDSFRSYKIDNQTNSLVVSGSELSWRRLVLTLESGEPHNLCPKTVKMLLFQKMLVMLF
jgi:hypothetical protein